VQLNRLVNGETWHHHNSLQSFKPSTAQKYTKLITGLSHKSA